MKMMYLRRVNNIMSLAEFAFAAVMASDEMFVLRKKKEMAEKCPWMTQDELNDYMMDLYEQIQRDKMYGDDW
jgi:hypothetical protein